ncbi:hypothetical protein LXA43DRAFT_650992 [Ganoderma leucocontextum]|nr:hypothetical protein LXA43DRAFT_650992 [Ganoderma leucocontextum]
MPDLAAIPTELWQEILTIACTDGGSTGRSLALTNRFLHAQSFSSRFHSLAFTSLPRVEAFLDVQPNDCRPRIEHLYLSFAAETELTWNPPPQLLPDWSAEQHQANEENSAAQKRWSERFVAAMTRLFALAGPHLHTLCMLDPAHFRLPPFPFDTLPNLREATLQGGCDLLVPNRFRLSSPGGGPQYPTLRSAKVPSLERLHCVSGNWYNPVMTLSSLVEHPPPSFTHLRLSGVATATGVFPPDLAIQLGVRLDGFALTYEQPPAAEATLPHLRHIVIHGMEPEPPSMRGYLYERWGAMYGHFQEIAREVRTTRGLQMVVLSRPWRRNPRWGDRLFDDWTDRLAGGSGCWVSSEEEEMQREAYGDEKDEEEEVP